MRGRDERLGLVLREAFLLEPGDYFIGVDHERLHMRSVYHLQPARQDGALRWAFCIAPQ